MIELSHDKAPRASALFAALGVVVGTALLSSTACADPLPDFRQFAAGAERKSAFFGVLRPLVRAENDSLRKDRSRLVRIAEAGKPGWLDSHWLRAKAQVYSVALADENGDLRPAAELIEPLLRRADIVPMSLALAQAALESGWGTSRFARDGNNFYGHWCFTPGCGMVPASRAAGATHEVRYFDSPADSIASYMRNINTHRSYAPFRDARARQRAEGRTPSGLTLAATLEHYSERRGAYVDDLKALIVQNDLEDDESATDGG